MNGEAASELAQAFRRLSVDVADALSEITVPAVVLNRRGEIRWLNAAALKAFGKRHGQHYSVIVAPEARRAVNDQFSRKIAGASKATSYRTVLVAKDGQRFAAEVDSVRLEDHGHVMGVFGLIDLVRTVDHEAAHAVRLTPRQREVLALLAGGRSTDQIAAQLHLSRETVRHHVRNLLRRLDAHTRLEAVARARSAGIV